MADEHRHVYQALVRARRFDEISLALQRQGALNAYGSARGQEGAHVTAAACLEPQDWLVPSYRQPGALLERGARPRDLWAHYAGLGFGWDWREIRCLPYTVPLGTQLAHATGMGWAARLDGSSEVVLAFFGDGASSQGETHEAMNFAGVVRSPVVFVCENNGWAISTPWERQSAAEHIADRAVGYGFPGVVVDGQDPSAVREAVTEALQRARAGEGPTLIEALTYRLGGHTTSDDPTIYRDADEVAGWEARDPVQRYAKGAVAAGELTADEVAAVERDVEAEFEDAVAGWQRERGRA